MSFGESWKALGNKAYQNGEFEEAIAHFSRAIEADPTNPIYWSNRALAYASIKDWQSSLVDANKCIAADPKNIKGHFRRVKALIELDRILDARLNLLFAIRACGECKDFCALEELLYDKSGTPVRPKSTDFEIICELGDGNFSKVFKTYLKKNKRVFAIKTIEKQTVDRMKRRHPNINNEILMEKRALQKLHHPGIVTLFATFQDYGTLYYQMEYVDGCDLWTFLHELLPQKEVIEVEADHVPILDSNGYDQNLPRARRSIGAQLGCHWSLLRVFVAEMISVLEHMHCRGIVHRDIKPENIILTSTGHLKFVDFGTAKDLLERDLNGQEFVGTPEYMSPETLSVKSGGSQRSQSTASNVESEFSNKTEKDTSKAESTEVHQGGAAGVGIETDIWAMGVVVFQLVFGFTPFRAASPYLTFLRIKRDLLLLPSWLPHNISSLIRDLLVKDGQQRMINAIGRSINSLENDAQVYRSISYDSLRQHDFFSQWNKCVRDPQTEFYHNQLLTQSTSDVVGSSSDSVLTTENVVGEFSTVSEVRDVYTQCEVHSTLPSLHDLCIRATADAAIRLSFASAENGGIRPKISWMQNFHLHKRLSVVDKERVMSLLEQRQQLHVAGVLRLFHSSLPQSRCSRASVYNKEVSGLTHSLQGHHSADSLFASLSSPMIGLSNELNECEESAQEFHLKNALSSVNKMRAKALLICGPFTAAHCEGDRRLFAVFADKFRKSVARVSETIPTLFVCSDREVGVCPSASSLAAYRALFGADYFAFWLQGMRGIVINSSLLICGDEEERAMQSMWIDEQIEQAKLCASTVVLFSYHPFFYEHIDEEDIGEDQGVIRNIPIAIRHHILHSLQHHKVKYIFSSAHNCKSTAHSIRAFDKRSNITNMEDVNVQTDDIKNDKKDNSDSDSDSDSDGFDNVEEECAGPEMLFALSPREDAVGLSMRLLRVREDSLDCRQCTEDEVLPANMQEALKLFESV